MTRRASNGLSRPDAANTRPESTQAHQRRLVDMSTLMMPARADQFQSRARCNQIATVEQMAGDA